jgi:hypothetical protein
LSLPMSQRLTMVQVLTGLAGCLAMRLQSLAADQLGLPGLMGWLMRQQSLQAATPMSPAGKRG